MTRLVCAVAKLQTLKEQLQARGPVWYKQLNGADNTYWQGLGGGPWLCPTPASVPDWLHLSVAVATRVLA